MSWPEGQEGINLGDPVLAVHVYNRGRGCLVVQWVDISETFCGIMVGPVNAGFPLAVEAHTVKAIYFPATPPSLGGINLQSTTGKEIRANVLLGTGKRKRSNNLVMGTARRHARGKRPQINRGPKPPPDLLRL